MRGRIMKASNSRRRGALEGKGKKEGGCCHAAQINPAKRKEEEEQERRSGKRYNMETFIAKETNAGP